MKDGFILHSSAREIIEYLDPVQVKTLMLSMLAYNDGDELPEMDPVVKMAFIPLRQQMDRENEKYQETCKKRAEASAAAVQAKQSVSGRNEQSRKEKLNGLPNGLKDNQMVKEEPNGSKDNQMVTDKDTETDIDTDKDNDIAAAAEKKEKESCAAVINLYNSLCPHYPSVQRLSEKRCQEIRNRLKTHSMAELRLLFTKADQSAFLRGKQWVTFDWLIQDANMAKVLDGNYDDHDQPGNQRAAPGKTAASKTRFNNFGQRSYDYQSLEGQLLSAQAGSVGG